jgi:hypothetical protein
MITKSELATQAYKLYSAVKGIEHSAIEENLDIETISRLSALTKRAFKRYVRRKYSYESYTYF